MTMPQQLPSIHTMKTNLLPLLTTLLIEISVSAQAQDFRAVPPSEQPNAAELAYSSGTNPNVMVINVPDSTCVRLVTSFLHDLANGQLEAAHQRLAEGFVAYGPSLTDSKTADDLFRQWELYGQKFANQRFDIETATAMQIADGVRQGVWVFVRGVWSGQLGRPSGMRIRIPFYTLAHLVNGLIERTHTIYGTDQLFYDRSGGPARFRPVHRSIGCGAAPINRMLLIKTNN